MLEGNEDGRWMLNGRFRLVCVGTLLMLGACVELAGLEEPHAKSDGVGGDGGSGGTGECMSASQCPGTDDACQTRTCTDKVCGFAYSMAGTTCNETGACDGAGKCKLSQGNVCTVNGDCVTGQCVDGVCCESACTGTCKSCNLMGFAGSCQNVPMNQDDANGVPACMGTNQSCDGAGVCNKENGQTAADPSECLSGFRADGVCCDSSCTATCKSCNMAGSVGTCTNVALWQDDADTCSGTTLSCDGAGACKKEVGQACTMSGECLSEQCVAGVCSGRSCIGLSATCGPLDNENCCTSPMVTGGTYNRGNDTNYPATVSDFRLDRFEITVGRFRKFVEAYPGSKPAENAGAHPLIGGSGWSSEWDTNLPADQAALKTNVKCGSSQTWTDVAGVNEGLPINCLSWFEAFAFCAWDGGRLPTEAEWNYAAAGGSEQREYPWSNPPSSITIDGTYAVYDCLGDGSAAGNCVFADILKVGAKSQKGDGKWSQADLGGSMWEWNVDCYQSSYANPCNNCADVGQAPDRVIRGGSWLFGASNLRSSYRFFFPPTYRNDRGGARCARTP